MGMAWRGLNGDMTGIFVEKRGQLVMDRDAVGKPIFSEVVADQFPAVGHDIVLDDRHGDPIYGETALG